MPHPSRAPWSAFAAIAAATALGWAGLMALSAGGIEAICGGSGLPLLLGAALMWGLMAATMMLPCAIHDIAAAARQGWRVAARLTLVCVAPPTLLVIGLGMALTPAALGTPILLAIAGSALVAEAALPAGPMRLGAAVAMVALQLIGGMELGWMALCAVWMLALALAPARRLTTAAAGAALLGLAMFWNL
ncbi:hypothetical protein [Devosia sp. Root105]|uniref:hypothetical protein n=1 Tax=Devosia sp. Root105 TaxID=1736423 RepID=UPI00071475CF|nr:hypothetical protein [Devosia sp. Root105]KQU94939.1 hypothetical protein ASC68_17335 [Devosia sp. Root105]